MVILFDIFKMPEDIFSLVFATEQQVTVAKLFLKEIKAHGSSLDKSEMSIFANALHSGLLTETEITIGPIKKKESVKISYNKRQFYDRILTPMKGMGMIDYDMYKKQYIISDKFNKAMYKIGLMWIQHIQRK